MNSFKTLNNIAGWLVFAIAAVILGMSAEPTGSLWDCGEFISGAYKLQVVHPPGAPIFLLIGRMFAWVGSLVSDKPETIAFAVNLLSVVCTAFTGMFVCWITTIMARLTFGKSAEDLTSGETIVTIGAGVVAGLTASFLPSVWFSAVEGEVYAMSLFFTALTMWAVIKWYNLPDNAQADKWLIFAIYAAGLSVGVHLLSLLTFPALALLYYFKKTKETTWKGALLAAVAGVLFIAFVQIFVIVGLPKLWAFFDKIMVNSFGAPFNSGIVPLILLVGGIIFYGLHYAKKTNNGLLQKFVTAYAVLVISYASFGMVVIRANANPPINMNDPSDPMRLLPYLNREQYGERPLLRGPDFDAKPADYSFEKRLGRVGDRYEVVDEKIDPVYSNATKKLFPRLGDYSQGRPQLYRKWLDKPTGSMTFIDNLEFFWKYQVNWMYFRYFMWNFSGRQNGTQGYYSWDPTNGNWITGIDAYDSMRLGDQSKLPEAMRNDQARNKYYMIPFLLGLFGLFYHYAKRRREFLVLLSLFIITGLGIIVYSNQPPNEPRERDYVLVGSFIVFAMWIGIGVVALYDLLSEKLKFSQTLAAPLALIAGMVVPALHVNQNYDDCSRAHHYGARDYASNFLNSCEKDAIIFTYGDNDTYPLWYAQEVEKIRTDVRVVNLSLIAVDWYISQMRRAVNDAKPIKFSIPEEQYRGYKRVQIPIYSQSSNPPLMSLGSVIKYLGEEHPLQSQGGHGFDTHMPTHQMYFPVDKAKAIASGAINANDSTVVDTMFLDLGKDRSSILKDELALLDIVYSNLWERPIYWAVTAREEKLLGLRDYLQLEGLSLRIVPVKSRSEGGYGMVGSGRVNTDLAYKNIMERWKWGNFDKERTYINTSYGPSLQTMRISFIRTARNLVQQGDKAKAISLVDKYFEVFPQHNFPYDYFTTYLLDIYVSAGANDKAAAIVRKMIPVSVENLSYYDSQKEKGAVQQDYQMTIRMAQDLKRMAGEMKDTALAAEIDAAFATWKDLIDAPDPSQFRR